MRVMVIVKATPTSEAGQMPDDPTMFIEMDKYNDALIKAGVMLDGAGLHPSSKGARVSWATGKPVFTDGPFAETKELIAGYWLWQVKDWQEALDWAAKCPNPSGDTEGALELRQIFEPEDFPEHLVTPEMVEKEAAWRDDQAAKAPKG